MNQTRIEKDSMGELHVPEAALYAAQTQRPINNFPVSGQTMPAPFIRALLLATIIQESSGPSFLCRYIQG